MNNENIFRTSIDSLQEWNGKKVHFDPDSSPIAWMHFNKFYKNLFTDYEVESPDYFTNVFDNGKIKSEFVELKCGCKVNDKWYNYVKLKLKEKNRLYAFKNGKMKICKKKNVEFFETTMRLSGDTDFNFNDKKVKKLKKIVDDDKISVPHKDQIKILIDEVSNMHHTLLNFSLMQSMGRLQQFKGKDILDRLDKFIYSIRRYFNGNCEVIKEVKQNAGQYNWIYLKNYLDSFGQGDEGFYNYCSNVYFVGIKNEETEAIINRLIESGKEPIDSSERVSNYIELAKEFWYVKEKCYEISDG